MQTAALGIAWLASHLWSRENRACERLTLAGLFGSLASVAFIVVAPGNGARQMLFPVRAGWFTIVKWSLLYAVFMVARPLVPFLRTTIASITPAVLGAEPAWLSKALALSASPVTIAMTVCVGAALGFWLTNRAADAAPRRTWMLWSAPAIAFVLVVAAMAPGAYGTSAPPPPRALIVPGFAMTVLAMCWGFAAGEWLRMRDARHGRAVLAIVGVTLVLADVWAPLSAAGRTFRQAGEMRAWAARWDESDRQLRLATRLGQSSAAVPAVGSIGGVGSIGSNPPDWVSGCAAQYYGLQAITGVVTR